MGTSSESEIFTQWTTQCVVAASQATEGAYRWRVGNGKLIGFWTDPWIVDIPFVEMLENNITQSEWGAKVRDYWLDSGNWNW